MKRFILLIVFSIAVTLLLAQVPEAINYQAIIRGNTDAVLSNEPVNIRISLLEDNITGNVVYCENHSTTTNNYGIVNLAIGTGTVISGTFDSIDWGGSYHFVKIELDTAGGTNYYHMGTSQLLTVPYAFYANEVATVSDIDLNHWNTAYSWGDHALAGYLTGFTETDPIFGLSAAYSIVPNDIINWNNASSWGNHALAGYLTTELDPRVGSNILNHLPKWDGNALIATSLVETNNGSVGIGISAVDTSTLLHVGGVVRSDSAFKIEDATGSSDTLNQITAFDFSAGKLKYKTSVFRGGIMTYISNESVWVDSVGDFIFPDEPPSPTYCPGIPVLLYQGRTYHTVLIGTQCWMKENLNVGTMVMSTAGESQQSDNGFIEKFCYNNDTAYCVIYGGLYEWDEAMQYVTTESAQGICPQGWHIPSHNEWKILEGTVDSQYPVGDPIWEIYGYRGYDAGGNLKETGTVHWLTPNLGATNSSGFTAVPAGVRMNSDGSFQYIGANSAFWTSSTNTSTSAIKRNLLYDRQDVRCQNNKRYTGKSIRCVKDN
ncbi:MAG: fibrobacter succinogenes major paralogous domain-containing protein [Bacteroidales bacterium]|nr:fibrobacter succinogenes major paralogous domain-containing protein [Lentimicrobiaceae bacterium]MDD5693714.1 fibrobacter succinogenes major paralogous domain-containing protein [Bacteroidales bacterium]